MDANQHRNQRCAARRSVGGTAARRRTPRRLASCPLAWLLPLIPMVLAGQAGANTLVVGPGKDFPTPSAAASAARDGDTIQIEPGQYFDCTILHPNRVVIEGTGPGVVITDRTCQGKALFIVMGDGVTIRDLTLARARVPDGNGAGIRLEGDGLTLERVHFVNDQVGLLSGSAGANPIRISDCQFESGGRGGDRPLYAVMIGPSRLLRVEGSTFKGVAGGQISTSALRSELAGNHIDTGTGEAPAVAVLAIGGSLLMEDNVLSVGPNPPRLGTAVLAVGEGPIALRRNRLENATGHSLSMLINWSGTDPIGEDNKVGSGDEVLSTSGLWWHRASSTFHGTKDWLHDLASQLKHGVKEVLGH